MYDGSSFPFEVNLENSIKVVQRAHAKGISVEGETDKSEMIGIRILLQIETGILE